MNKYIFQIELTDEISQEICHLCANKIVDLYEFYLMYVESDRKLRTILKPNITDAVINTNDDEIESIKCEVSSEWNCSTCLHQFTTENSLKTHENQCDKILLKAKKVDENRESNANNLKCMQIVIGVEQSNVTIWECYKCHIEFKTMRTLKTHSGRCEMAQFAGRKTKYKGNYHINDDGQFICNLCNGTFRSRTSVYDHIRQHSGQKFLCNICGRFLSSRNNLTKHYRTVHLKEKNYQCSACEKRYDSSYRLRIHQNSHDGIRQFNCKLCSRNFLSSSSLARHRRTVHSQGEEYSCPICLRKFNIAYNMRIHMHTHSGIRPHICGHCNAGFHRKIKLQLHLKEVHGL